MCKSQKLPSSRDFRSLKTKHKIVFNQFQSSCVLERFIKMPFGHFLRIVFLNQIFHLRSNDSIDIKTIGRRCNNLNLAQGSTDRQVLKFFLGPGPVPGFEIFLGPDPGPNFTGLAQTVWDLPVMFRGSLPWLIRVKNKMFRNI